MVDEEDMTTTFEEIAAALEQLAPLPGASGLHIQWLVARSVAVGRDAHGAYCVVIAGPTIVPSIEIVASAMRDGQWQTTAGEVVEGNLLTLPSSDPFRTATAAIAAELFRRGIESRDPGEVFEEIEGFVALVLRRVLLPDSYVLGLVGELLLLREILVARGSSRQGSDDPTACWRGWQRNSRDFDLGRAAIEVKTTGLAVSRHTMSGLEQIEPRTVDGGAYEELYVASIGLRTSFGSGLSIASLTDEILGLLHVPGSDGQGESVARTKFLDRLRQYGPKGFDGYEHEMMRGHAPYLHSFTPTFVPRVYDMMDENVRLIRRTDLAERFQFVLPQGLQYTFELPDVVPGSIENPRTDLRGFLRTLLASKEALEQRS